MHPAKKELFEVLKKIPRWERRALLKRFKEGKIDGGTWWGLESGCGCFFGTLASLNDEDFELAFKNSWEHAVETAVCQLIPEFSMWENKKGYQELQNYIGDLREGDTPETSDISQQMVSWFHEFGRKHGH